MSDSLTQLLVCPRDHHPLARDTNGWLTCDNGHRYPVVDGVPVLLIDDAGATLGVEDSVLRRARGEIPGDLRAPELYLESLGLSDDQMGELAQMWRGGCGGDWTIDPAVQFLVGATCGVAYKQAIGHLTEYPIPDLPLATSNGGLLIDIGCNWGRWSIAAARKGYRVIGVDPQLGAVMAARRVARQLGLDALFVCADARHLPIDHSVADVAFSYSVLQHFNRENCLLAVREIGRILRQNGQAKIQMASAMGIRSAYHLARRRFRKTKGFEVRYYTPGQLLTLFRANVGPANLTVDCYFGLGLQATDSKFMSAAGRMAMRVSEMLKTATGAFPPLTLLADSLYVKSVKA